MKESNRNSFLEERTIQVLVVPISIEDTKFQKYCSLLQNVSVVDLRDVTRAGTRWASGKVHYNFVEYRAQRNQWEDIQSYRKIVGVIGIGDIGTSPNGLADLCSAFEIVTAAYPTAQQHRLLLGVEPLPSQLSREGVLGDAVVVPTGDLAHLTILMQSHVFDFTSKLLVTFERDVYTSADAFGAYIATPLDSCKTSEEVRVMKKKKTSRLAKCRGDRCLQAGQLNEAMQYYNSAIAESKLQGDWEWIAGAFEGQCAALLAFNEKTPAQCSKEIRAMTEEAMTYYERRGAWSLQVELLLKTANYEARLGCKVACAEKLLQVYTLADKYTTEAQEKLPITGAIALIFKKIGFTRKYAFYLWIASVLHRKTGNLAAADYLLKESARSHFLAHIEERSKDPRVAVTGLARFSHNKKLLVPFANVGWTSLQIAIMMDFMNAAKTMRDNEVVQTYAQFILRSFSSCLSVTTQHRLIVDLTERSLTVDHPIDFFGRVLPLPILTEITPLNMPGSLTPESRALANAVSPFIYSFQIERRTTGPKPIIWVAGEICQVDVQFRNPLAVDITVTDLSLCTRGVQVDLFPQTLTIAANTTNKTVPVLCKPATAGDLTIFGVIMQAFGCQTFTPILPSGVAWSDEEFYAQQLDQPTFESGRDITVIDALPMLEIRQEISQPPAELNLIDTQLFSYRVVLENTGKVAIGVISLSVVSSPVVNCCHLVDERAIKQMRVEPGQRVVVCVAITAHLDLKLVKLTAKYRESEDSLYERTAAIAIRTTVNQGLEINSVTVYSMNQHATLNLQLTNHSSVSFLCHNYTHNDTEDVIIEGNQLKNVIITVPQNRKPSKAELMRPVINCRQQVMMEVVQWLQQTLAERIRLTWTTMTTGAKGKIDLTKIPLTEQMIPHLVLSPLSVSASCCDLLEVGKVIKVTINVTINGCEEELKDKEAVIHVLPVRTLDNGSVSIHLTHQVAVIGTLQFQIPLIATATATQQTITRQLILCFLQQGKYTLLLSITDLQGKHTLASSSLSLTVSH